MRTLTQETMKTARFTVKATGTKYSFNKEDFKLGYVIVNGWDLESVNKAILSGSWVLEEPEQIYELYEIF